MHPAPLARAAARWARAVRSGSSPSSGGESTRLASERAAPDRFPRSAAPRAPARAGGLARSAFTSSVNRSMSRFRVGSWLLADSSLIFFARRPRALRAGLVEPIHLVPGLAGRLAAWLRARRVRRVPDPESAGFRFDRTDSACLARAPSWCAVRPHTSDRRPDERSGFRPRFRRRNRR